jgi:hypothetical protein
MLALAINAWRTVVDDLPLNTRDNLIPGARLLRLIMALDWVNLKQTQRQLCAVTLAKVVREEMDKELNSQEHTITQTNLPITYVVDLCFTGMRQVSFTLLHVYWCAGGHGVQDRGRKGVRVHELVRPNWHCDYSEYLEVNLENIANGIMQPHLAGKRVTCAAEGCDVLLQECTLILDGAPPTLICGTGFQTMPNDALSGAYHDWQFRFRNSRGIRYKATYRWKADIYCGGSHFNMAWRDHHERCWQWDGLKSVAPREQAFDEIEGSTRSTALRVYERTDLDVVSSDKRGKRGKRGSKDCAP